jgi:hypothetical protein
MPDNIIGFCDKCATHLYRSAFPQKEAQPPSPAPGFMRFMQ